MLLQSRQGRTIIARYGPGGAFRAEGKCRVTERRIPSALPKADAQPKAERPKPISLQEISENRVKIPLCQTRSLQLLQKSLSAIATIPMSIKIVFSPWQTVSGKTVSTQD
jgi:hypothetical protein